MKHLLILAAVLALACTACDNDDNAKDGQSPVFDKLTLTPNPCNPGDSVYATVTYVSAGKGIYKSKYYYKIEKDGEDVDGASWSVVDPTKSQPTFSFVAPTTSGYYTVTFGASQINYSGGGPNGELYGSANSVNAGLSVRSK